MMSNRIWDWVLPVGIMVVVWWSCGETQPRATTSRVVDSLRIVNTALEARVVALSAADDTLRQERDRLQAERDAWQVASDSATARLRRLRASLPAAGSVTVAELPARYAQALSQLDAAHGELWRKDSIIRADSVLAAKALETEQHLRERIVLLEGLYANSQTIASDWERKYQTEVGSRPRCGRKCGAVLGVVATVGVAIGVRQVQIALNPQR